ncbi:hypothetical protein RUM43_001571 [Polyplax serrata]|uniref:Uncharacterized protein n=1 Tax=Polyplax serrata TaxID=468196 RepID=A0AAN8XQY3_POLSC
MKFQQDGNRFTGYVQSVDTMVRRHVTKSRTDTYRWVRVGDLITGTGRVENCSSPKGTQSKATPSLGLALRLTTHPKDDRKSLPGRSSFGKPCEEKKNLTGFFWQVPEDQGEVARLVGWL